MDSLGRPQKFPGVDLSECSRRSVAGLRCLVPWNTSGRRESLWLAGSLLGEFAGRKFRRSAGQPNERGHALLAGVARAGADRGVYAPVSAIHVGVWISIVSGNANDSDFCETGGHGYSLRYDAGPSEK